MPLLWTTSLGGVQVDYHDVNSNGVVVGDNTASGWTPILWPADEPGTVRELPMPAGHQGDGLAVDIDEDGAVVGHLSPYLWPAEGQPSPLMVPAGSMGGSVSAVEGGPAAGSVYDPATNATVPAVWDLRTGGLTLHKDVTTGALSVNGKGTIGTDGSLAHADSRVARVSDGTVNTVSDTDVAAGTTGGPDAQAMRWVGC